MSSLMLTAIKYQPIKAVYTLVAVAFNAARLPLWILYYMPPSLRQNPQWTFSQALRVRIVRAVIYFTALAEPSVSMSKKPGSQKNRYVTFPGAQRNHLTDFTVVDNQIQPVELGGTWYPAVPDSKTKPGFVVLHFHGGAFAIGDGRDADAGFAAKTLLKHTDATHVFCPQYRLATHPKSRFPAVVQDAIASYTYLLYTIGVEPSKIIISGDSAGGNMTLGLLRYIADHGTSVGLPPPGCAWAWSPWVCPHDSKYKPQDWDSSPLRDHDFISKPFGNWGATAIEPAKSTGLTLQHPCINFLGTPFRSETPIWIQAGSGEVLFHSITRTYEEMRKVEGNKVDYFVSKTCPHDIILVGDKVDFVKEAQDAAVMANNFLRSVSK